MTHALAQKAENIGKFEVEYANAAGWWSSMSRIALLLAKEVLADADAETDATAKAELMGKVVMLRTMFMVMAGLSQ
jgi:hypothetical protein